MLVTEVESNGKAEETGEDPWQDSSADEHDKNCNLKTGLSKSDEIERSSRTIRRDDSGSRSFSSRVFNCQGKKLRINIPLTAPSRTFSAIGNLFWEDFIKQSSKKASPRGFHVNKTKLHHAEKMIRGAFIELYTGLGYLKTYRYFF